MVEDLPNKLLTIPKEKHIHRMKNGSLNKMPLSKEEIIVLIKYHKWNVEEKDDLADLIDLLRSVEKVHGIV